MVAKVICYSLIGLDGVLSGIIKLPCVRVSNGDAALGCAQFF